MLKRLLTNRDFILLLAIVLGLAVDGPARHTRQAILPALGVVMTLSLLSVSGAQLRRPGLFLRASLWGVLLNYGLLAGLTIALASLVPMDPAFRGGFLIIAAMPPAVAIIPFTEFLKGDGTFSLLATAGGYLAALVLTPLMFMIFWRAGLVDNGRLIAILLELVVTPLVLSRIILALGWQRPLAPWRGPLTNWCFFLACYSIVGLNAPHILADPLSLWPVALVAFLTTLALAPGIGLAAGWAGVAEDRRASLMLLGTLKNHGLAGGLALALFSQQHSLPAVVSVVFLFFLPLWLGFLRRLRERAA